MNTYGGVEVYLHAFLTSALSGGERSASSSGRFIPGILWIEDWVDSRAGLDAVSKKKIHAPAGNRTPVVQNIAVTLQTELFRVHLE
jgi:hypothetical protein